MIVTKIYDTERNIHKDQDISPLRQHWQEIICSKVIQIGFVSLLHYRKEAH